MREGASRLVRAFFICAEASAHPMNEPSGVEEHLFCKRVRGRVIRAIVNSTRKLAARNSSNFRLFAVRGLLPGIFPSTSAIFAWLAGL
jgi:hypothetical protein